MKRPPTEKHGTLELIHPLTRWCFCLKCKYEFTREKVWEINTRENSHKFYLCMNCAPTKGHAVAFAKTFRVNVSGS